MGSGEETVSTPRSETASAPGEAGDAAPRSETAGVEPAAVEELRRREENTIAEFGRVIGTVLVDYEGGASPESVERAVREKIASEYGIDPSEAPDRCVQGADAVRTVDTAGTHTFVLVELPSDDVFVDRVFVPEDPSVETPERERYRRFVDRYGDVETLPQLAGEHVPITYDPGPGLWRIAVADREQQPDSASVLDRVPAAVYHGGRLVAGVLLVVGLLTLANVPTAPAVGAVTPRSLLSGTLLLLGVAFAFELLRGSGLTERLR